MRKKTLVLCVLLALAMTALGACKGSEPAAIAVTPTSAEIAVGETVQLTASGGEAYTWSSDNESVAAVSDTGLVTGISAGTATITVASGGTTATSRITVVQGAVPVLELDMSAKTLHIGDEFTLQPRLVLGGETVETAFTFVSADPGIVTVDADGVLTAVALGETTVSVSCTYNGLGDTADITVRVVEDVVLALDKESVELVVKTAPGSSALTADTVSVSTLTENGSDVTQYEIKWTVDDETVASVSDGTITARAAGTTSVTATYTTALGTAVTAEVSVNVTRETIAVTQPAEADVNWDFGANEQVDYMHIRLPEEVDISENDVIGITDADGAALAGAGGFTVSKSALALGEHSIRISTADFIYALTVRVTDTYLHITDYDKCFTSKLPSSPDMAVVGEMDGRSDVISFTTKSSSQGGIWYNHCGYLSLDRYDPSWRGGYFLFDIKADEGVIPGGYIFGAGASDSLGLNQSFLLNTETLQFSSPYLTIVDENYEPTAFVYGAWNRVIIDIESIDPASYVGNPSILFSFGNPAGEVVTAYYSGLYYMSAEKYAVLRTGEYGYVISFDTLSDAVTIASQRVPYWGTVEEPADPVVGDLTFEGWYYDGQPYDFSSKVTGNMTLTAKYTGSGAYTVEHYIREFNGGYVLHNSESLSGEYGATVTAQSQDIEGYTYNAGISEHTGTVPLSGSKTLVLKLYYEKDDLTFEAASSLRIGNSRQLAATSNCTYAAAEMTGEYADDARAGTYLFTTVNHASGDTKRIRIPQLNIGQYLVFNVYYTNAQYGVSMKAWEKSETDGSSSGTHPATLYDADGNRMIPIVDVVIGKWVSWVYYADPAYYEGTADTFLDITLSDWVMSDFYVGDWCWMTAKQFATYFEQEEETEGVTEYFANTLSVKTAGSCTYTYAEMEGDDARPNTMLYAASASGGTDGRRLRINGTNLVIGGYLVLDIYFAPGSTADALTWQSSGAVYFTFYDETFNKVADGDKTTGTWYKIAVQVNSLTDETYLDIGLADWSQPEVYISAVYSMTADAFAALTGGAE